MRCTFSATAMRPIQVLHPSSSRHQSLKSCTQGPLHTTPEPCVSALARCAPNMESNKDLR